MKAGLILVMFGFIQYQIIMLFSIFRSLKKLVAFHVSKYIFLLNFSKGYTHEIYKGNYAHFNIEHINLYLCTVIDMNVTNNMAIKSYISIRKSIFPPKYPSLFPSHRHNIHIHTYALVHSYLSWMTSFFEPLILTCFIVPIQLRLK